MEHISPFRMDLRIAVIGENTVGPSLSALRPGDTVSSTDFIRFLDESWEVIPKRFKRKTKGL